MFWQRSKKKRSADDDHDDLTKLQKQFGIKPVSDADVQAEFQKLFGGNSTGECGSGNELSPTTEQLLFGDRNDDDDDEEAKILRELQINGRVDSVDIDALSDDDNNADDDIEDEHYRSATGELHGLLVSVHAEAKRNAHSNSFGDPTLTTDQQKLPPPNGTTVASEESIAAQVHAMKLQALVLKREGRIQEALALFRDAKQLQERDQGQTTAEKCVTVPLQQQHPLRSTSFDEMDDDADVEVTDEDMNDPNYLAQLRTMGLTEEASESSSQLSASPIVVSVEEQIPSLEFQIHEMKLHAVQLKRENQIAEALATMRQIKEVEAKLANLKASFAATTTATSSGHVVAEVSTTTTATPAKHGLDVVVETHLYTTASDQQGDDELTDGVEVTDEDMNDPGFQEELQKLGFSNAEEDGNEAASETRPVQHMSPSIIDPPSVVKQKKTILISRYSSIDDELIDEFDEGGHEEEYQRVNAPSSMSTNYGTEQAPSTKTMDILGPLSLSDDASGIADLSVQLQKAKESALRLKRDGNIKEALEMMRRVKQIENLIQHKQQQIVQHNGMASTQISVNADKFQELERLLVDFGNRAMVFAKENLGSNRAVASEWLSKRKAYEAELEKLRLKRQNPLQQPPPYMIERTSRQLEVELSQIPEDRMYVTIKSVNGLSMMAGKDIFVKFCLNFPSSAPHQGQTRTFKLSPQEPFSTGQLTQQNTFGFKLQRSRGIQRLFELKKATFEVWKPGNWLNNAELIARSSLELKPFLSTCQVSCHLPFLGSNRKPTGGDIEIVMSIRSPLKDKEMRLETIEELKVGEYPEPTTVDTNFSASTRTMQLSTVNPPPASMSTIPTQIVEHNSIESDTCDTLGEDDPHHPDLIVSYDVINEELTKIEAKLPSLTGAIASEWRDRYDSLALKKQILEIEMQTGKLTLEMYIEKLHNRIREDRVLLTNLVRNNRRMDAARVLHRIKVMEKELEGAESDCQEG